MPIMFAYGDYSTKISFPLRDTIFFFIKNTSDGCNLGLCFISKKGLSKNDPFFICVNSIHNDYNVSISYFKPSLLISYHRLNLFIGKEKKC